MTSWLIATHVEHDVISSIEAVVTCCQKYLYIISIFTNIIKYCIYIYLHIQLEIHMYGANSFQSRNHESGPDLEDYSPVGSGE